jgi:3-hydroxyacyl-[acyl-carrier-protein] dehydratase
VLARGRYAIPADIDAFPASLVAEAVGQLAAWAAMAVVNFQRRPVAGIAAGIELLSPVQPGQTLELAADLEAADAEAVSYHGSASADGVPVIRLTHCVGPMVLMAEYDDPDAVRERFALLCDAGVTPGGFAGLPPIAVQRTDGEPGKIARASLAIPGTAKIFADHFPRRPVFPGSLLMHVNLQLASELAAEIPASPSGNGWRLRAVHDLKLRAFVPPGESLETELRLTEQSEKNVTISVETRNAKRLVGGARVEFVPEDGR